MGVIAATQDPIAQTNVRTTILDKIAVKDAMKRAEAAIKQQVYVTVGVILDGGGYTVNRFVMVDCTEIAVVYLVVTATSQSSATI